MSTRNYGNKVNIDYPTQLYELVGANFPLLLQTDKQGNVQAISFETEWKEGGTDAIEQKDGKIKYVEQYSTKKLSKEQIEKLEKWIKNNTEIG